MKKESSIEWGFVKRVEALGCIAVKYTDPANHGAPDRLILIPGGTVAFLELKCPGGEPEEHQRRRMNQLRSLGFDVMWTDNAESGYQWIRSIMERTQNDNRNQ